MKSVDRSLSFLVPLEVDKSEPFALALLVERDSSRSNSTEFVKKNLKLFLRHLWVKVFDIKIGELRFLFVEFGLTLFARDMVTDVNLFIVEHHAIHGLGGTLGRFGCFIVNEPVSPGAAMFA